MQAWYFRIGLLLGLTILVSSSSQSSAKTAQRKRPPDLSGIWEPAAGMSGGAAGRGFSKEIPPLQRQAMEQYKRNRAGLRSLSDKGLDQLDPLTSCFPPGEPRSMIMPYPFEIVQQRDAVYIFFEYGSEIRKIHTDGRKHPENPEPTWMGDSVGSWQGDTLVVDTTGIRPETWIDPTGIPHSDALHVVERFRRPSHNTLEVEFSFDDPKAFTQPWGGKRIYESGQEDLSPSFICEEKLQMPARPAR